MRKVGGLIISRKVGEEITLLFQKEKVSSKIKLVEISDDGSAAVSVDGKIYDMHTGDSVSIGDGAIFMEDILGGRASIRLILSDAVRILRTELLS